MRTAIIRYAPRAVGLAVESVMPAPHMALLHAGETPALPGGAGTRRALVCVHALERRAPRRCRDAYFSGAPGTCQSNRGLPWQACLLIDQDLSPLQKG